MKVPIVQCQIQAQPEDVPLMVTIANFNNVLTHYVNCDNS